MGDILCALSPIIGKASQVVEPTKFREITQLISGTAGFEPKFHVGDGRHRAMKIHLQASRGFEKLER